MAIITTKKGEEILVDDEDYDVVSAHNWHVDSKGYPSSGNKAIGRRVRLHRFLMGCKNGDGRIIDHKNGAKLDNRRVNLRDSSPSENLYNRGKMKRNKSGYKGVSKSSGKWKAFIGVDGKHMGLGSFETPEDAYRAYCEAAIRLHGEFVNLGDCDG